MPKILIAEIFQVLVYVLYAIVAVLTGLDELLYFALGFILAIMIPSLLAGWGFSGIKSAFSASGSSYERFRGLPVAHALWGILHLVIAVMIFSSVYKKFTFGINYETVSIFAGFCLIYLMTSLSQVRGKKQN